MADYHDPAGLETSGLIKELADAAMDICGSPLEEAAPMAALLHEASARLDRYHRLLNTPEVDDFAKAVALEAAHQRLRWPADHDEGKSPFDWFWLLGYLGQKAAFAAVLGDLEKARHHTISTASALANWHLALSGGDNSMRPGIEPPNRGCLPGCPATGGWRDPVCTCPDGIGRLSE